MPKPNYFKCNYCYSFFKDKTQALVHEKNCTYNPQNKHCDSCRFRILTETEDEIKEYKCEKGFEINKNFVACEGKNYFKACIIDLQKRSYKKEFEV